MALRTDYKDDVLDTSVNSNRRYVMTSNDDGSVSLADTSAYLEEGDTFGASDINATNAKVNEIDGSLNGFSFGVTADGKPGYKRGASTEIIPFKTSTSLSVRPEGGKRWCRLTVTVNSGTITYGGKIYTAGQSIVIQAQNPPSTQEDVPADAGWHGMVASS